MKIRKQDLPRKNVTNEKILYSLAKAINNMREGTFIDCFFESEAIFKDYLHALVKINVIIQKEKTIGNDLSDFIFVPNSYYSFDKKASFMRWLSSNIVGISLGITSYLLK